MSDEYGIDSHKLIFHPERVAQWCVTSDDWEKAKKVYPIYLEISPSGACNHRCTFCAMDYVGNKYRFLDMGVMRERIPEMSELGIKSIMFAGEGEPLIFRQMSRLLDLAFKSGIDVAFSTNGVYLDQDFVDSSIDYITWIKVSIGGGTAKTYAKIHRTREKDFGKVVKNLRYAVNKRNETKAQCTIGAQVLLLPENAHEVEILARLSRDKIGLDYLVIKPYSQHPYSKTTRYKHIDYRPLMKAAHDAERLSTENFKVIYRENTVRKHIFQRREYKACNAVPFFWAYVMSNYDLYSCSAYLGDKRFLLGNLREQSFKEIWEGEKRRKNFSLIRNGFDLKQCRINCRMDKINQYLWELKHPHAHVNFI